MSELQQKCEEHLVWCGEQMVKLRAAAKSDLELEVLADAEHIWTRQKEAHLKTFGSLPEALE